jgi:hypothetical protein
MYAHTFGIFLLASFPCATFIDFGRALGAVSNYFAARVALPAALVAWAKLGN